MRRMGCVVTLLVGVWFSIGLFFDFSAFAQCTPGTAYDYGPGKGGLVYKSVGTKGVPSSLWPSVVYGGVPSPANKTALTDHRIFTGDCMSGNGTCTTSDLTGTVGSWTGSQIKYFANCRAGNYGSYTYACDHVVYYSVASANTDYDCDGVVDWSDSFDGSGVVMACLDDADHDLVCDYRDPWPNDPSLPGTGHNWTVLLSAQRQSDGAKFELWTDGHGNYFKTWDGTDSVPTVEDIQSAISSDPGSWSAKVWSNSVTQTYDQVVGVAGGTSDLGGSESGGALNGPGTDNILLGELLQKEGEVYDQLSAIYGRMGSYGDDSNSKLDSIFGRLGEIKGAIEESGGGSVTVDLSSTNSKLDEVKGSVDSLNTKFDTSGSTDVFPDADLSPMQNNTDLEGEEIEAKKTEVASDLESFMDGIMQNNPLLSMLQGSNIELSGGSSAISFSIGGRSMSFDFSPCYDAFSIVGNALLGLAGVFGMLDFFKG